MVINIDILKDDSRYGKFDQVLDLLFCISSVIFAFALPFQFRFTPWIAQWFFAVLIFKIYYVLRGKEQIISIDIKDSIAIISLGCYGLWALLSTNWSLHPESSYKLTIDWLSSLLIIPSIYIFSCKRLPIFLMMKSFVCGCTVLIIYALNELTQTALNGDVIFYLYPQSGIMENISSVTYHHIYLGFIIVVSLFIASKFIFNSKTPIWEKLFYSIHSIIALFLLAIDNSRIVSLTLFASVLVFFIYQIKNNKKLALSLLIVFVVLIITFIVFPTRLGETIIKIFENGEADDPRFHIWKAIIPGIKEVPFLGYGYSAVSDVYADLFIKSKCWFALNSHYLTHNQFMESFFTLGYVGLSLIIIFLAGIVILIIRHKSMILVSMLILLIVSMLFEIPFCHCFAIPLLISWFTFCHSGKKNMSVKLPKYTFIIPIIILAVFIGIIAIDSNKAIKKYSSRDKIETTDFSQRKFTKKNLKIHKITEENIDMIFCKGESGFVTTFKDFSLDIRNCAITNTTDTLVFSTDYYISEDFGANEVTITANQILNNYSISNKELNLKEKNVWKSDSMIVIPSKIMYTKANLVDIRPTQTTDCKVSVQAKLLNAITFNDLKGYMIFKNMKIEYLHKKYNK